MANIQKVKAYLCEDSYAKFKEIRLLAIPDITFAILEQKIRTLFPDLSTQSFILTWIDDDGDIITISSDEELQQPLKFLTNGTFKVYIKVTGPGRKYTPLVKLIQAQPIQTVTPPTETTEVLPGQELHPNIVCDGCNGKVVGARFKCLICDDYDLCQACLNKNTHYDHDMIRIVAPTKVSTSRNWFRPIQHIWHKMARHTASIEKREEKIKAMMEHAKFKHCRRMQRKCGKKFEHSESATEGERDQYSEYARENPFLLDFQPFIGFKERADKQSLLKNIGASVANLLDPLGINVTIDVENSDGEIEPCATCPSKKDSETDSAKVDEETKIAEDIIKETEAIFKEYQESRCNGTSDKPKETSAEQTSLRNILSNIRDMSGNLFQHMQSLQPEERKEFMVERMTEVQGIMCEVLSGFCSKNDQPEAAKEEKKEDPKPQEAESEAVVAELSKPVEENVKPVEEAATNCKTVQEPPKDTGAIPKRASYPESSKPSIDMMEFPENGWTLLNKEASPPKETAPTPEAPETVTTDTVSSSSPKIYPDLTVDDDKYREALLQMVHMGYSNEGQWLSALIKAKNGDIAAVLEVLHPSSS